MACLIADVCLLCERDIVWYFKDPFWNYSIFIVQDNHIFCYIRVICVQNKFVYLGRTVKLWEFKWE